MTEQSFYERYWRQQPAYKGKGVAELPPEWNEENLERILKFCSDKIQGRVLDVGCGDGFFTAQILQRFNLKNVYGLDISSKAVDLARLKHPEIKFQQGALDHIPEETNSIDSVTMIEVIEHLVDIEGTLKELFRVMKPGGILLITTTDFNLLKQVIIAIFFFEKYFYPTNPHIRFFKKSTLADILSKNGFSIIKYAWNGDYLKIMPRGQMILAQKLI
jgi:2-polyprenyl-3-methyl-5-hydroxy-6-metoxy-1,4-benzoquinol methylase